MELVKQIEESDISSKLNTVKDFDKLTELQRKIIILHFLKPELTKKELSKELECNVQTVYSIINSPIYASIALESDKLELHELRQLAVRAIREVLSGTNATVKANTAIRLLESEGLIKDKPERTKEKEFNVSWGVKKETLDFHGSSNTLQPPPKAE